MFRSFIYGVVLASGFGTPHAVLVEHDPPAAMPVGHATPEADCLEFRTIKLDGDGGKMLLSLRGVIGDGDAGRFDVVLAMLRTRSTIVGLVIDSKGGDLLEAEAMAETIRKDNLPVAVVNGASCASACFLLFAAGSLRFVTPDSRVGVHSASAGHGEDMRTLAATTAMARDARGYGVPDAIVGRMVTTRWNAVAWLSPGELASMDVHVLPTRASALHAFGPRP